MYGFTNRARKENTKILESVRISLSVLGAKDGKHVGVILPADTGSLFYNFKNYFSVVLLGVCDSKYRFTFVDIGSYGRPDSFI